MAGHLRRFGAGTERIDHEHLSVRRVEGGPTRAARGPAILAYRPHAEKQRSLAADAERFVPDAGLARAINTAICLGEPLLITGEPGTGKTQTAYYVAWKLNLGDVLHFQVKSDTTAKDLLYHFDMVRYFQDAQLRKIQIAEIDDQTRAAQEARKKYREKRDLWLAFEDAQAKGHPRVLLIDEIDKAPRDFPNDLLHELGQMEIQLPGDRRAAGSLRQPAATGVHHVQQRAATARTISAAVCVPPHPLRQGISPTYSPGASRRVRRIERRVLGPRRGAVFFVARVAC